MIVQCANESAQILMLQCGQYNYTSTHIQRKLDIHVAFRIIRCSIVPWYHICHSFSLSTFSFSFSHSQTTTKTKSIHLMPVSKITDTHPSPLTNIKTVWPRAVYANKNHNKPNLFCVCVEYLPSIAFVLCVTRFYFARVRLRQKQQQQHNRFSDLPSADDATGASTTRSPSHGRFGLIVDDANKRRWHWPSRNCCCWWWSRRRMRRKRRRQWWSNRWWCTSASSCAFGVCVAVEPGRYYM